MTQHRQKFTVIGNAAVIGNKNFTARQLATKIVAIETFLVRLRTYRRFRAIVSQLKISLF